jgi:hypothetical protein
VLPNFNIIKKSNKGLKPTEGCFIKGMCETAYKSRLIGWPYILLPITFNRFLDKGPKGKTRQMEKPAFLHWKEAYRVSMKNTVEKRKHNRLKVYEDTYIALVNDSTIIGQIINISKGGVAFRYIGKEEEITDFHRVDIYLSGSRFYLKQVPFRAISDFIIENNIKFSTVIMKQCGGQFGKLTPNQVSQLDYFLANQTTG